MTGDWLYSRGFLVYVSPSFNRVTFTELVQLVCSVSRSDRKGYISRGRKRVGWLYQQSFIKCPEHCAGWDICWHKRLLRIESGNEPRLLQLGSHDRGIGHSLFNLTECHHFWHVRSCSNYTLHVRSDRVRCRIEKMVTAAMQYSGWQEGSNGIIANGGMRRSSFHLLLTYNAMSASKSSDIMLPRALATVIARNATTLTLQSYISAYLGVQVRIR